LTKERIKATLEASSWSYHVDSDGDIGSGWDHGVIWFFTYGNQAEILQVRGIWDGKLSPDDLPQALDVVNEWNCDRLFPKVYARINDEGQLRVISEHTLDYEHGLTDEQLNLHVNTGIATSCQLWERLNEAFPEAAAAAAAE
jgi:hypothetical protein